jgi:hypothetical protein
MNSQGCVYIWCGCREDIASLIIAAGCLIPGTQKGRHPTWRKLRHDVHTLMTAGMSRAHPARQVAAPYRPPTAQTAVASGQKACPAVRQDPQPAMRPYPGQPAPVPPHQRRRENRQNTRPERVRRQGLEPRTRGLRDRLGKYRGRPSRSRLLGRDLR